MKPSIIIAKHSSSNLKQKANTKGREAGPRSPEGARKLVTSRKRLVAHSCIRGPKRQRSPEQRDPTAPFGNTPFRKGLPSCFAIPLWGFCQNDIPNPSLNKLSVDELPILRSGRTPIRRIAHSFQPFPYSVHYPLTLKVSGGNPSWRAQPAVRPG